jgi:hypothetical protein
MVYNPERREVIPAAATVVTVVGGRGETLLCFIYSLMAPSMTLTDVSVFSC